MVYEKKKEMRGNIWRSDQVGFLRQSRESWICMRLAVIHWNTCKIITRRPWCTRGRTIGSILLSGLRPILSWFATQVFWVNTGGMGLASSKGEADEGSCVSWGAMSAADVGQGGEEVRTGDWTTEEAWDTRDLGTLLCKIGGGEQTC
jgi:hypothetical protein